MFIAFFTRALQQTYKPDDFSPLPDPISLKSILELPSF
jgi:hypothetical protein